MSDKLCILHRCGQFEGPKECCDNLEYIGIPCWEYDEATDKYSKIASCATVEVLREMWKSIQGCKCAQFVDGKCITRYHCKYRQSYCYPIPLRPKRANKLVVVFFAWWCADFVEAVGAVDAVVDAAAKAADGSGAGGAVAWAARAVVAAGVWAGYATYMATGVVEAAAVRDEFYRIASEELMYLIDTFGSVRP